MQQFDSVNWFKLLISFLTLQWMWMTCLYEKGFRVQGPLYFISQSFDVLETMDGVFDAPEYGRSKLVNRQIGHWNSVIMLITQSVRVILARQSCQNSSCEQVNCSMCRVRIRIFLVMKNNGPQLLGSVMHNHRPHGLSSP